jgi:hypothetical protein
MHFDPGAGGIGKRVFWDCVEIARGNQIGEMLRRHLLVLRVLISGCTHVVKIFSENIFIARTLLVGASCNKEQREYYDRVALPWIDLHCCTFRLS